MIRVQTVTATGDWPADVVAMATNTTNGWIAKAQQYGIEVQSIQAQTIVGSVNCFHIVTIVAKVPRDKLTTRECADAIAFLEGKKF